MLTSEEQKELEAAANVVSEKLVKRMLAPHMTLLAGELGLAGWLTWLTWNHTAAAVIWTLAVIVWVVSLAAKAQAKKDS
jgi:hypothetical protein